MFRLANTQSWTIASRRRCVHLPAAMFSCRALSLLCAVQETLPFGKHRTAGPNPGSISNADCTPLRRQVLLYLEQKFAEPMTIYIKWPANANNLITEQVEERSTIDDVMQIMINLQVVAAWAETADVVVRSALPREAMEPPPECSQPLRSLTRTRRVCQCQSDSREKASGCR